MTPAYITFNTSSSDKLWNLEFIFCEFSQKFKWSLLCVVGLFTGKVCWSGCMQFVVVVCIQFLSYVGCFAVVLVCISLYMAGFVVVKRHCGVHCSCRRKGGFCALCCYANSGAKNKAGRICTGKTRHCLSFKEKPNSTNHCYLLQRVLQSYN